MLHTKGIEVVVQLLWEGKTASLPHGTGDGNPRGFQLRGFACLREYLLPIGLIPPVGRRGQIRRFGLQMESIGGTLLQSDRVAGQQGKVGAANAVTQENL